MPGRGRDKKLARGASQGAAGRCAEGLAAKKPRMQPEDAEEQSDEPRMQPEDAEVQSDEPRMQPEDAEVQSDEPRMQPEDAEEQSDEPRMQPEDAEEQSDERNSNDFADLPGSPATPEFKIQPKSVDLQITVPEPTSKKADLGCRVLKLKLSVESINTKRKIRIEPSTFDLKIEVDENTTAAKKGEKSPETLNLKIKIEEILCKDVAWRPKTIVEIRREAPGEDYDQFVERVKRHVTPEYRRYLQDLRQHSGEWRAHRHGRITASSFWTVWGFDRDMVYFKQGCSDEMKMVDGILSEEPVVGINPEPVVETNPAIRYGIDNKEAGKALYVEGAKTHKKPKSVKITDCGIFLDSEYPLVGASPNALVTCDCCEDGLILVKCCYKHRDKKPAETPKVDRGYHIIYGKDIKLAVRTNSYWYYQVVGLLGVTGRAYCDVVAFTNKGIESIRVQGDPEKYETLMEYCTNIYHDHLLDGITKLCKIRK